MAINKTGVPQRIEEIARNEKEFEQMKEKVAHTNDLVRCISCGKLIAKKSGDVVDIKRKDLNVVAEKGKVIVACPVCNTKNPI